MKKLYINHSKNVIIATIGAFFNAFGVNCFIVSSKLGEGGTIGLSLLLKYTMDLSPAISSLIINMIVIAIGWKYLNKQTAIYTLITVIVTSIFLDLTEPLTLGINDSMVNAIFAGVFIGLGAGMIIASGSTLGGPSVIAKI
ncbi:YitT family protein, partial [Staphylococcus gallinarum]|uniref:YitT family protein n=2 Tax=Staphylococcus TaxID=1279 RepID=UPI000D49E519